MRLLINNALNVILSEDVGADNDSIDAFVLYVVKPKIGIRFQKEMDALEKLDAALIKISQKGYGLKVVRSGEPFISIRLIKGYPIRFTQRDFLRDLIPDLKGLGVDAEIVPG